MSLKRREVISAALGFVVCFAGVAAGAYFWSSGVEDRIVERIGVHPGRVVERDVQIHPNPSKSLDSGSEGGPALGGSGQPLPPRGPGSGPAPAPPKGGNDPPPAPQPSPTASNPSPSATTAPSTPISSAPVVASPPPSTLEPAPTSDPPGLIQSTVEQVDDAITPTVCGAAELLRHLCP